MSISAHQGSCLDDARTVQRCHAQTSIIPSCDLLESRNVNVWDGFSVKRRCVYRSLTESFRLTRAYEDRLAPHALLFITWDSAGSQREPRQWMSPLHQGHRHHGPGRWRGWADGTSAGFSGASVTRGCGDPVEPRGEAGNRSPGVPGPAPPLAAFSIKDYIIGQQLHNGLGAIMARCDFLGGPRFLKAGFIQKLKNQINIPPSDDCIPAVRRLVMTSSQSWVMA